MGQSTRAVYLPGLLICDALLCLLLSDPVERAYAGQTGLEGALLYAQKRFFDAHNVVANNVTTGPGADAGGRNRRYPPARQWRHKDSHLLRKIGRASCRERGWVAEVAV